MSTRRALNVTREQDFPAWYQAVVREADLAEVSPVCGCMIIKPWGYGIWELIQADLDRGIKALGNDNCYFPLFIPLSFLAKEAEHVEGFAKQMALVTHHRLKTEGGLLHEDDLAGRVLASEKGWEVVSLPMEAETEDPLGRAPGELLWPEWFTPEMVEQAKRDTRVWSALYQQRPAPEKGDYFKADWLKPVDILPARETMNVYGASDYAVTSKGGDYTVHIVVGVDAEERMYVLDLWRGQADSATWIEEWCSLVKQWRPKGMG
jgi:hypothetical protein